MGLEPITRGLKDRYSSQLSYEVINNSAEEVGVEPTRVVSSEQFSRLWPPPFGLSFLFYKKIAEDTGIEPVFQ